ncbi:sigma-70 family RNA polymerase sigma factor [Xenococcus sp. PCC 7305]|uniref:sigma-70 family RNA polymerase sigma factor n=1 Tax=Xenococcus sp. PCC 7305 TaxID=102125 RepID=UPI00130E4835|nr:sigma-70 family RNA polymerase sigma factor [Xenococcus sp. PCC 7305]
MPDASSQEKLVLENQNLAYAIANKLTQSSPAEFDDLAQVGLIGLIKAARNFDAEKGRFRAYAGAKIRGEILHYLRDKHYIVRFPRRIKPEPITSLDVPVGDGNIFLVDTLRDRHEDSKYLDLYLAIAKLEPREREVIELQFLKGMALPAIARAKGFTAWRKSKSGLQNLRQFLS